MDWTLHCSECDTSADPGGLPTVCPACGAPWLVRLAQRPDPGLKQELGQRPWTMWRYREWLPLLPGEEPVSLGEGATPLLRASLLERRLGMRELWVKDEGKNPTGSFKARGLAAAVTRARAGGATRFTIPTAGNAGVALAAYGTRAGASVRVYAPRTTPTTILQQIRAFGAELMLLDGHIGDCGKASRAYAQESGAFDVSTLREPYRIEGKKTLGLELAEQLGWRLPDAIVYPAGGGTGVIGMWKVFGELRWAHWLDGPPPRLYCVQSSGCAPVVKAFESGADGTEPWPDPVTVAAGLRVPAPLGGRLMLRAMRETKGGAVAVRAAELCAAQGELAAREAIDAAPEGGATLAALEHFIERGEIGRDQSVVLFNTGAGWLYR
ncbi:MAG: threonine synthase [Gemmatimonadetes bacterium]|nr:threonine synthase [Gemmatimonadota bacterium]